MTRHMYHYDGMTDVRVIRQEADGHAAQGERVVVHLHPYYDREPDGCPAELRIPEGHYEPEVKA